MNRNDIGARLRAAREQQGLALRDIAETTKISTASLQAMERSDFGRLPGGVFRRAYVQAFASEVGLDPDEVVREFRARYEPKYECEFPGDAGRVRHVAIALVVAIAILACGVLIFNRSDSAESAHEEAVVFVDETSRRSHR